MAANDIVLVIGEGWTEIENATAWITTSIGETGLQSMVNGMEWGNVSQVLEDGGYIAPNTQITEARMINVGTGDDNYLRFWFRQ